MNYKNISFWRFDPMRGPDWRWTRASTLLESKKRAGPADDEATHEICRYRRELARHRGGISKSIRRRWPDLAAAHELHQTGGGGEIQARLLAGESFGEIAAKTGVAASVVMAYESAFFNVADALQAVDWLLFNVLRKQQWTADNLTPAQTWQWVGVAAGPVALDILIAEDLGRTEPVMPGRAELAAKLRFAVSDAAMPTTALGSADFLEQLHDVLGPEGFQAFLKKHPSLGFAMRAIWVAAAGQGSGASVREGRPSAGGARRPGSEVLREAVERAAASGQLMQPAT